MIDQLERVAKRFGAADRETRLQALLSYARRLPELPPADETARAAGEGQVHECQTPVYLRLAHDEGTVALYAHAPAESPTVRGFLALLQEAVSGATLDQVAAIPEDLLDRLGLASLLGMTRTQGLNAILSRVRITAREALG